MTLGSGTKLGRYEIRSKIGAGGMGEVYRARDEKLNRYMAIKSYPPRFRRMRISGYAQTRSGSTLEHNLVVVWRWHQE